jgi:hypothetical protein
MDEEERRDEIAEEGEREHLLTRTIEPLDSAPHSNPVRRRWGAIWQVTIFTVIGVLIALGSGAFAYLFRQGLTEYDFIHVPLPDMHDPRILRYFGGLGPWIGWEYFPPPEECTVTQVHMISRHGERYPTRGMGNKIIRFAQNISSHQGFGGALDFLNEWTIESDNWLYSPDTQLDQETLTGPAAGSVRMFTLGNEMRSRYYGLWDFSSGESGVKVWASDSMRVIHSAKYFSSAFFGVDIPVQVEVIPETAERWGDSLTTTYFSRCQIDEGPLVLLLKVECTMQVTDSSQQHRRTIEPSFRKSLNE